MSILTRAEARKLKRPMTIDLKYMNAKEYVNRVEGKDSKIYFVMNNMKNMKNIVAISGIVWFLIVSAVGWGIFTPKDANASYEGKITYEKLIENSSVKPPFIIYSRLKDECYRQNATDKWHCIKTGLSIAYAECSWKDYNTPFGLQSREKGYEKWVRSYNKYWYTARDGFFFYGDWGKYGRSHYCTSEESSGSSYGCPNGRKNFQKTYDSLNIQ